MSEPRLISPMLDNFIMGDPISDHHGIRCCPAMENDTENRYIVKVISVPASPSQIDALLLSGAYSDEESALAYFKSTTDSIVKEVTVLEEMAELEGFLPYRSCQVEPMESGKGYDIYLLGTYKRSLDKHFKRHKFTHLDALNLGLDLCAALSVCRRSGYLYVDLKPSNVFVTEQKLYCIGDLGFIRLDSLKYASLPEKYLSAYTAPEIRDAFSSLNTTMDVYAAGLILYQTYNGGELPFNAEITPGSQLPAPMFADYEMSEIILKACAPNPDDRWQDPMQMGQAIVNYMQRNGASDTLIVPAPSPEAVEEIAEPISQEINEELQAEETECEQLEIAMETTEEQEEETIIEEEAVVETQAQEDAPVSSQDELSNLSILEEDTYEEEESSDYNEVTEEVSEMLTQADELATVDVPEPVVVPDYVEVPMPEPIVEEVAEPQDETSEEESILEESEDETEEIIPEETEEFLAPQPEKKKRHWLRNSILVLLIMALLAGGYYYYNNHYLLPIEFITVDGNKDTLTVLITTEIDESLLCVICSDTYGNQITAPVEDGKAVFTGLVPNTAYTIKVVASGFHRLTGNATTAYSTPIQTNIVQFDAINGNTEGSVILNFTVEGLDCDNWNLQYSAEGEEVRSAAFNAHMLNLTGLTVDKEYTFTLIPSQALYLTGQYEIKFTPRKPVKAENVEITNFLDEKLTVVWTAPAGENVSSWSVHCYSDNYNQTIITSDTTVTFEGIDCTADYKVEIKAASMSVGQTVTVLSGSVIATDFNVDTSDKEKIAISWNCNAEIPEEGWVLYYSIVGIDGENSIVCLSNQAEISPVVPSATYKIRLEDANGNVLLNSKKEVTTSDAPEFTGTFNDISITSEDLEFYMCRTPNKSNWGRYDLEEDDYTTTFVIDESASFLIRAKRDIYYSNQNVTTTIVIRDQSGAPIHASHQTGVWSDMWSSYNCKLNLPEMPAVAGEYTVELYFNGGLAIAQPFTITE